MLNECTFIGNLGADPEIKTFGNGGKVANIRLGVTKKWNDRQSGDKKEKTEWIPITLRGDGLIGVAERFLKKGSKIYVRGEWTSRKWQDAQGNDRYTTEVVVAGIGGSLVMLDGAKGGGGSNSPRNQNVDSGVGDDFDDDMDSVPF